MKEKIMKRFDRVTNKQWFYFILVVSFLFILILNCITPYIGDDFSYSYGLNSKKITNINDIFAFQVHHYLTWGGRSVVHTIAQIFLIGDKWIFNIANSLCYVVLTYIMYRFIVTDSKEYKPVIYLLIHMLLWFLLPAYGENILWLIGACNYLWGATILLAFLLVFRLNIDKPVKEKRIFLSIAMFVFGIVAGWTNENTAAAGCVMIVLFGIYRLFQKEKIASWHITGFLGMIIGFAMMILAPGNMERSKSFPSNARFIVRIYRKILEYSNTFMEYLLPTFIIFIIISIIAYYYGTHRGKKLSISLINVFAFFASIYSMVLSPVFPERAWMGPVIFLVLAMGNAIYCLDEKNMMVKNLKFITVSILFLIFCLSLFIGVREIRRVYLTWNDQVSYMKSEVNKGNKDVIVPRMSVNNKHVTTTYLNEEPNIWPNTVVARYYHLNSIKAK